MSGYSVFVGQEMKADLPLVPGQTGTVVLSGRRVQATLVRFTKAENLVVRVLGHKRNFTAQATTNKSHATRLVVRAK